MKITKCPKELTAPTKWISCNEPLPANYYKACTYYENILNKKSNHNHKANPDSKNNKKQIINEKNP